MTTATVEALETTIQKTHIWLKELVSEGHFKDESQAYSALRAVLQAVRDRLTVDEAANLAAEMPLLIRGIYYEGWKPAECPVKQRTRQEFVESVRRKLRGTNVEPANAIRVCLGLLQRKISAGEIADVRAMMPRELQELWPQEGLEAGGWAEP